MWVCVVVVIVLVKVNVMVCVFACEPDGSCCYGRVNVNAKYERLCDNGCECVFGVVWCDCA